MLPIGLPIELPVGLHIGPYWMLFYLVVRTVAARSNFHYVLSEAEIEQRMTQIQLRATFYGTVFSTNWETTHASLQQDGNA